MHAMSPPVAATRRPVKLRRVDGDLARLRRLLGTGRRATLASAGGTWVLEAVQADPAAPRAGGRALCMETPHGLLAMVPSRALMRMLTCIDLGDDPGDPLRALAFDLALQALPAGWLPLFQAARLRADDAADADAGRMVEVALRIRSDESPLALCTGLRGECDALAAALSGPGWQRIAPVQPPLPDDWRWRAPLCIGRTLIRTGDLLALQPGDVLRIGRPLFDLQGAGSVALGGRRARCRWATGGDARGNRSALEVTEWDLTMDATMDHDHDTDHDSDPEVTPGDALDDGSDPGLDDPVDRLPVELGFELGRIELSLRELRALAPGGVIAIAGGGTADVRIRAGGRVIGHGELVEVDGALGVEVTRLGALD